MLLFDDYQTLNQKDKKPSHFVYDQLGYYLNDKDLYNGSKQNSRE